jgi:hypothetical protein
MFISISQAASLPEPVAHVAGPHEMPQPDAFGDDAVRLAY